MFKKSSKMLQPFIKAAKTFFGFYFSPFINSQVYVVVQRLFRFEIGFFNVYSSVLEVYNFYVGPNPFMKIHSEVLLMKILRYLRRKVSKYLDGGFCIYLWVYKNAVYRFHRFLIPFPCQTGDPSLSIHFLHDEPNLTD